ncbi:MFS transporter [Neoroseomonas oryzicola]|uniref:OFA family MFS transporter n=1 Tax=Neoroseomonas oryzicola TaxID=535904 RepID=A0A9X9WF99_9PROT|nr:OFA family MFS transporter [Neoroseomonas oryzicola]MBR0659009.1 OFA family MFS transporter [Neoroseomonas oryzicola]NKE19743.1 OFA family MFS transporter [Neoroseomonas oryzicola]
MTQTTRVAIALAAVVVLNLPLGTVYAFSVFLRPMETLLGLTRAELSFIFGITLIAFTLGMNLAPWLYRRAAPAILVGAAAAIAAGGMALAATASGLADLALGYGALFGIGGGAAYALLLQGMNLMPITRRGLVNGFIVGLYPAGAMLGAVAFGWSLGHWGLRATLGGLAATLALAGLASALLVLACGMTLVPQGIAGVPEPPARQRAIFLQLWTVFFLAAAAGLTVLGQAAGMVEAYGGTPAIALGATTGIAAAIAVARIGGGWLADRVPASLVMAGAHLLAMSGNGALWLWPSAMVAIGSLVMVGVGYGLVSGSTAAAIGVYWGANHYGRLAGRLYVAWCVAAVTLPVLAGRLFDLTGGYGSAILIACAGNALGCMVAVSLPRSGKPSSA